jgi:NitT/TauT family transport system permease protein
MKTPSSVAVAEKPQVSSVAQNRRKKAWQKKIAQRAEKVGWLVASLTTFVLIWESLAFFGLIDTAILPPPHQFLGEIANQEQFFDRQLGATRVGGNFVALTAIAATLKRVFAGIFFGFVAAFSCGLLASYFRLFGNLTLPTFTLLAPISATAWIPLAILLFGVGDAPAIFIVFIGIFFSLTLATVDCVKNVDQLYINTGLVLGASRWQIMRYIVVPAIIPSLFVVLRVNFFAAWASVLAAEMVGVNTGLGAMVMVARQMFNVKLMFLGMTLIGLVGYSIDVCFAQVQNRVLWWKAATKL